jgi:glutathione S-transferase
MKLYIGNKNYSSWSMRPWVLMRQAGIDFEEAMVPFDSFDATSRFKRTMAGITPAGRVPVLVDDDGFAIWDTLAIAETLAERFPAKRLWPVDARARARARSLSAEMHAGFAALRSACTMNVEASLVRVGQRILMEQPDVRAELDRIVAMWTEALSDSGGPLLFGHFTIADAFFAPVVMRIRTYGLPVPPPVERYVQAVTALPGVAQWIEEALEEKTFIAFEEPYRTSRD